MGGLRDTYMDQHARSFVWVPGPGAHRTARDFCNDAAEAKRLGREGKTSATSVSGWQRACSTRRPGRKSPVLGDDFDAKRTWLDNPKLGAGLPKAVRNASLGNLRQIPRAQMPSSFATPGPGSYSCFTTFGMASGPTRKRYFGTNRHDNDKIGRSEEKFFRSSSR